jgi:hypothetical protein
MHAPTEAAEASIPSLTTFDFEAVFRSDYPRIARAVTRIIDASPSSVLETRPLKTADMERALARAGVSDIAVPKEWEGLTLIAEAGPVVVADYNGVQIVQSAPFRVNTSDRIYIVSAINVSERTVVSLADSIIQSQH